MNRGQLILVDDPLDHEELSEEKINEIKEWYIKYAQEDFKRALWCFTHEDRLLLDNEKTSDIRFHVPETGDNC